MNPLKRLAGETAIYGFSSIVARLLNYLLVVLYTRVFTTEEYGIINELYAYSAFLIIILTYGMETGFFRFINKHKDKEQVFSTAIISLFTSSLFFIVMITLLHTNVASLLDYEQYSEMILMLGITVAIDAFSTITFAKLRSENRAVRFVMIKVFNITVNILMNLIFLLFLPNFLDANPESSLNAIYNPDFGIGYVILSNLTATLLTLIILLKEMVSIKVAFSMTLLKRMLTYSLPLLISGLAGTVNESVDRIMLRWRLPDTINAQEQLGIYGANIRIAVLMVLFIQMFRYAAEPFFFRYQGKADSQELYAKVMKYFVIAGILIFLGITFYLDVFKHIIGSSFHEGLNIVPVVLFGNLLLGVYFNLSVWYKLTDNTKFGAYLAITGAAVTIGINFFLIPFYGYMASAWAHVACYAVMCLFSFFLGKRYLKIPYDLKRISVYFIFAAIIFLIAISINFTNIVTEYIIKSLLIVCYCTCIYYMEKDELIKKHEQIE